MKNFFTKLFRRQREAHPYCSAVVAAGGSSRRMGGENKLTAFLDGVPVLARTLLALDGASLVDEIVVAVREEDLVATADLCKIYAVTKPVKIVRGGADKSYGIQVAKLAGVPDQVIARAKELVEELSSADIATKARQIARESANVSQSQRKVVTKPDEVDLNQMTLYDTVKSEDIIKEIEELQINDITPMEALNILSRMQGKLKNRW